MEGKKIKQGMNMIVYLTRISENVTKEAIILYN